jgi:hypothetical protein
LTRDNVLFVFGIVLTVVGVVLFARSKVRGENSMRLLGVQVQVSHPSLFIFFTGVLLMLLPYLQHEPAPAAAQGDPTADEAAAGDAPTGDAPARARNQVAADLGADPGAVGDAPQPENAVAPAAGDTVVDPAPAADEPGQ